MKHNDRRDENAFHAAHNQEQVSPPAGKVQPEPSDVDTALFPYPRFKFATSNH
jgi:hypothetical protein